jgi:toxin-antitoxin system PIN domain toxin
MTCFPDVNVWIALIVAEHIHHRAAIDWYEGAGWDVLVFSRVTQMGFLRLLTNPHIMGKRVVNAKGAWEIMDQLCGNSGIILASEPAGIETMWRELTTTGRTGSSFWTDAYLAAFAQAAGYTLVTFDRGFEGYKNIPLRILNGKP